MNVSTVATTIPSVDQNLQVKIPIWKRIALLVVALVATLFSLGVAPFCSTTVSNWYKEFWSGRYADVQAKPAIVVENKRVSVAVPTPPVKIEKKEEIDKEGNNALHLATSAQAVKEALGKASGLIEARNAKGETPLLRAVSNDCKEAVEELLKSGANVDATDNGGNTALHLVKSEAVANQLMDKAAHLIDETNVKGEAPFQVVSLEVASLLLERQYKLPAGQAPKIHKALSDSMRIANQKRREALDDLLRELDQTS